MHRVRLPYIIHLLSIVWIGIASAAPAVAQNAEARELDEVPLVYRFSHLVQTDIIGYYDGTHFYLPIKQILDPLFIYNSFDWPGRRVSGYVGNLSRSFSVNLATGRYTGVSGNIDVLEADDYHITDLEIYLRADLFQPVFGIMADVNLELLFLKVTSEERLPIQVRADLQRRRSRLGDSRGALNYYEPLIPRNHRLLNGFMLDYNMAAVTTDWQRPNYTGGLQYGAEILGGDFQGSWSGSYSPTGQTTSNTNGNRWRYYNGDGFVKQVLVGELSTNTVLSGGGIRGVRVTNEPLYPKRVYEYYTFTENVEFNSDVELYLNGQLYDYQRADDTGIMNLTIPVVYGINDIRIVKYLPDGRVEESSRRLNIPFTFAPAGEVRYDVSFGSTQRDFFIGDANKLNTTVTYGINRNNSVVANYEYLTGPNSTHASRLQWNTKLFRNVITAVDWSPGYLTGVNMYLQSPSNSYISASAHRYTQRYADIRSGVNAQYSFTGFHMVHLLGKPFSFRGTVSRTEFDGLNSHALSGDATFRVNRVTFRSGSRWNIRQNETTPDDVNSQQFISVNYSTTRSRDLWAPLRGVFIYNRLIFDDMNARPTQMETAISRNMFVNGSLQMTYTRQFGRGLNIIFLTLSIDLGRARSGTSIRTSGDFVTMNQTLRGSVAFDPRSRLFLLDSRTQVGRGGVIARLFVDENDDGIRQETEEVIREEGLRVEGAGAQSRIVGDYLVFSQLRSYDRYNASMNMAALSNPTLVPENKEFSFIADPNQFKHIPVRFLNTGVVEGSVRIQGARGDQPQPGATVFIRSTDGKHQFQARTFFDGTFYQMEIPPGEYTAHIDTSQTRILNATPDKSEYSFTVRQTAGGDYIAGLDFMLVPNVPVVPVIAIPEPEPEPVPVVIPHAHRVQGAAMPTFSRAMLAKLIIEDATGVPFEIAYSERLRVYRVFSRELDSPLQARSIVDVLTGTEFDDAFEMDVPNLDESGMQFATQLGAFRTSVEARVFADTARARGVDVHVTRDPITGLHRVITVPGSDYTAAWEERNRLRAMGTYPNASVIGQPLDEAAGAEYLVQVAVFTRRADAFRLSEQLTEYYGIDNYIYIPPSGNQYHVRVRGFDSLDAAFRMRERIMRELGFEDTLVLTSRS